MAALRLGLSWRDALDVPYSELMDLITADAVRSGRLRLKPSTEEDEAAFWAAMERE